MIKCLYCDKPATVFGATIEMNGQRIVSPQPPVCGDHEDIVKTPPVTVEDLAKAVALLAERTDMLVFIGHGAPAVLYAAGYDQFMDLPETAPHSRYWATEKRHLDDVRVKRDAT